MLDSTNQIIALVLGLASLIGFGVWLYFLSKKHEEPLGEILVTLAVQKNETIFVLFILAIFFTEALVAATVHPPGQSPPNVLARMASHLLISIGGAVASITFVRDFASLFEKGVPPFYRFIRVVILFVIFILAFGIPINNVILIAAGTGEDLPIQLFFFSINPMVSDQEWANTLAYYGKEPTYSGWGGMSYILKTTVVLTFTHILVSFLEGLRNIQSPERKSMLFASPKKKDEKKKDEPKKEDAKPEDSKKDDDKEDIVVANFKYLLSRVGYKADELSRMVKTAQERLYHIKDTQMRNHVTLSIARLVNKAKELDNNDPDNSVKNQALKKEIRELFEGSPKSTDKDTVGLGLSVKGGGKN